MSLLKPPLHLPDRVNDEPVEVWLHRYDPNPRLVVCQLPDGDEVLVYLAYDAANVQARLVDTLDTLQLCVRLNLTTSSVRGMFYTSSRTRLLEAGVTA